MNNFDRFEYMIFLMILCHKYDQFVFDKYISMLALAIVVVSNAQYLKFSRELIINNVKQH